MRCFETFAFKTCYLIIHCDLGEHLICMHMCPPNLQGSVYAFLAYLWKFIHRILNIFPITCRKKTLEITYLLVFVCRDDGGSPGGGFTDQDHRLEGHLSLFIGLRWCLRLRATDVDQQCQVQGVQTAICWARCKKAETHCWHDIGQLFPSGTLHTINLMTHVMHTFYLPA